MDKKNFSEESHSAMSGFFYGKKFPQHFMYVLQKRIIYTPSVIAGLSVLLLIIFWNEGLSTKNTIPKMESYRLIIPMKPETEGSYMLSESSILKMISTKSIKPYIIKGNALDSAKFRLLRDDFLRINFNCDTNTLVKVHFSNTASYGDVFRLIRMMHQDKIRRYVLIENDFYIFGTISDDCREINTVSDSSNIIQPIYL
jgi:hypothetical protein